MTITGTITRTIGYGIQTQALLNCDDGIRRWLRVSDMAQSTALWQAKQEGKRVRVETMGFAFGGYLVKDVEVVE